MPTIPATTFSILASLAMILAVFIVPQFCVPNPKGDTSDHSPDLCPVHPFSLLIYCHTGYWLLHFVIDIYLKKCHKTNRLQGYLLFYRDTKNSRYDQCLNDIKRYLKTDVTRSLNRPPQGR